MSENKYEPINSEVPMTDERLKADKDGNAAVKETLPPLISIRPQKEASGEAVKKTAEELAVITERNRTRGG